MRLKVTLLFISLLFPLSRPAWAEQLPPSEPARIWRSHSCASRCASHDSQLAPLFCADAAAARNARLLAQTGSPGGPMEPAKPAPAGADLRWLRRALGIATVSFGAAGATLMALSLSERARVSDQTDGMKRNRINARIDTFNTAAVTCYVLAGGALATYLVWKLWPDEEVEVRLLPTAEPQVQLSVRF